MIWILVVVFVTNPQSTPKLGVPVHVQSYNTVAECESARKVFWNEVSALLPKTEVMMINVCTRTKIPANT